MSSILPEEIYLDILLRVPVKSTFACKCVCKSWLHLISDPDFAKKHLNLSKQRNKPNLRLIGRDYQIKKFKSENNTVFSSLSNSSLKLLLSTSDLYHSLKMDYPFNSKKCDVYVELVGSCNGLLCLWFSFGSYNRSKNCLCLWNPATKEYKQIPKSPYNDDGIHEVGMIAFEYDAKTADYKLLTRRENVAQVYSLRLNLWRRIRNVEFDTVWGTEDGVIVNGEFHWLAVARDSSHIVVSLDISEEIFKEIQLPTEPFGNKHQHRALGVLEGCLCILVCVSKVYVEVWVMKDYGNRDSWTKHHVINNELIADSFFSLGLVWSFKRGEILFRVPCSGALVLYDPKDESVRKRATRRLDYISSEATYFESLVPLNSKTYQGRRTRLPPRIPLAPRPPFRVCGRSTSSWEAPCKSSTGPSQK